MSASNVNPLPKQRPVFLDPNHLEPRTGVAVFSEGRTSPPRSSGGKPLPPSADQVDELRELFFASKK